MKITLNRLLVPGVLALAAATASGDILISNLASNSSSGTIFGTCATTVFKAAGFTIPAGGPNYTLDGVRLEMDYDNGGGGELGQYSIWEGAGTPTTRIASLEPNVPLTGLGVFSYMPRGTVVLEAGMTYWVYVEEANPPTGCMLWVAGDADPRGIAAHAGYIFNGNPSTFRNKHEVLGTPESACYADCDQSTGVGVLDVFDFLCFQDSFVNGQTYACDCDTSTGPGVCDVFDFLCFQDAFVNGCP